MTGYEEDIALWLNEQAALLRARRFADLDVENLAEAVKSVARSLERGIVDHLAAIMSMQWRNVLDREQRPNTSKMMFHRSMIKDIVRDCPSLEPRLADSQVLDHAWNRMLCDYDVDGWDLPERTPWTLDQVLNGVRPSDVLRRRRDEIVRTLAQAGCVNMRVFGSVARGEDREESDLDLLVEVEHSAGGLEFFSVPATLERILGVRVDLLASGGLSERFAHVLAEAIPVDVEGWRSDSLRGS